MSENEQPPTPPTPSDSEPGALPELPTKKNALIIGLAVLALLAVVGGGIGAFLLLNDSDEDKDDQESAEVVEVTDWCASMMAAYTELGSNESIEDSDPEDFADALDGAGITEDMSDEVLDGRTKTIQVIRDAESYEGIEDIDETFSAEEKASTDAFFAYYTEKCS